MAMNTSMTITVFVVVVMATTVIGSTPLQEQELNRNDRDIQKCCAEIADACIRNHGCYNSNDELCPEPCYYTDTSSCGSDADDNCCFGYKYCMAECLFQLQDETTDLFDVCYEGCKEGEQC
uniref:Ctr_65_TN conopeptide n=3 Tax=Splinoconus TaxID=2056757 RepID=A0A0C9R782_CONTD